MQQRQHRGRSASGLTSWNTGRRARENARSVARSSADAGREREPDVCVSGDRPANIAYAPAHVPPPGGGDVRREPRPRFDERAFVLALRRSAAGIGRSAKMASRTCYAGSCDTSLDTGVRAIAA